jgi:hypothetical protein
LLEASLTVVPEPNCANGSRREAMPLKVDDLKTVENYKKAIKQDLTKISPQGNGCALGRAG